MIRLEVTVVGYMFEDSLQITGAIWELSTSQYQTSKFRA